MNKFHGDSFLKKFDQACYQIHIDVDSRRPKDMLYQYMSYEGLKKIIETRKLRYTDYRYFNDPTEMAYGRRLIKQILSDSEIPQVNKELFLKIIDRVFDSFDDMYKIYVSCFSSSITKLSLWRYYGCNGTGFAIAFNSNFQKLAEPEESNLGKAVIGQVIYGEDNARLHLDRFISEYIRVLEPARKGLTLEDKESFINFLATLDSKLACHLISYIPYLKDESFSDEDEIRMFYIEGKGMIRPNTGEPFYFEDGVREFLAINKSSSPFVKNMEGNKPIILPDQFSANDISEIWVGPCCDFVEASVSIRKLLLCNGFDVDKIQIRQTELPYKNV